MIRFELLVNDDDCSELESLDQRDPYDRPTRTSKRGRCSILALAVVQRSENEAVRWSSVS